MTLHVVLWLWKGWRPIYTWRHVNAMVRMLRPNLPEGARILCVSDQVVSAWLPVECEVFPLWPNPVPKVEGRQDRSPNCFTRLRLLGPAAQDMLGIAPGDIVMSTDLDGVVCAPLRPLIEALRCGNCLGMPEHGCYCEANGRPPATFAAMGGLASRIHGSLFAFRAGTHTEAWTEFDPVESPLALKRPLPDGNTPIGSDQAWLSRVIMGEHLWHEADGCYSWNRHGLIYSPGRTTNARYWSFAGTHKPWQSSLVQQVRPDLHRIYMDAYGRA